MEVREPSAKYLARPAYKQTEVGVIPEDWKLGTVATVTTKVGSGKTPSGGSSRYCDSGRPFVRSQNIGWGGLLLDDLAFIDEETHLEFSGTEIQPGDVLLNITGASIGRCAVADERLAGGNVNQHVCIIRAAETDSRLVNFILLSSIGRRQIDSFQAGGNREGLNFGQVRSIKLPLPSLPSEQQAISEALSDADALIEALEQLLAKKRQIKQGAMQELLTGQRRLPGFAGEWEVKRLDELGRWVGGMTPSMRNPDYWTPAAIPWISSGDVKTTTLFGTAFSISEHAVKERATTVIPERSIVVVMRSGILRNYLPVAMAMLPMAINQDVKAILPSRGVSPDYLLHALVGSGERIIARCLKSGTTVESIEFPWLKALGIHLPPIQEQTAIATLLSDMDAEIAALEAKLAKARSLKQGMMQELLTGRIRLV